VLIGTFTLPIAIVPETRAFSDVAVAVAAGCDVPVLAGAPGFGVESVFSGVPATVFSP
jgi:hypothetical protein